MKILSLIVMVTLLPVFAQSQLLSGDRSFPLLREVLWGMSKAEVMASCTSNKPGTAPSDSLIVFDASFFGAPAKVFMWLTGSTRRLGKIDVKFIEPGQSLQDTLTYHLTRITGASPMKIEKEKSVLLFTLRMEVAVWKAKTERIILTAAKKGKSVFDVHFSLEP